MARTAPVPNIPPIPGMCPSVAVAGGGSDSGGSGGQGAGSGGGGGPGKGGGAADGTGGDGKAAPDPKKYPLCGTKSHPVDVVTGRAFTHPIVDFETAGPIPFVFERSASSAIFARDFGMGPSWAHTLGWQIELRRDAVWVFTDKGTKIAFPLIAVGDEVLGPFGWRLKLDQVGYEVDADDGLYRRFDVVRNYRAPLTEIRDRNDNRISLSYDAKGFLQLVTDSGGRQIRVQCDDRGHILVFLVQKNPGEWMRLAEYSYDANGRLIRAADADGHAHYYAYNERNQLTLDQDRAGLRFHFRFDTEGRCIESWGDYGEKPDPSLAEGLPEFLHDGVTRCKGIHHCVFAWGEDGLCVVTDSTQSSNFFGNQFGLIDKMVEGGGVTTAVYRADGHLMSATNGEGGTETFERDERGRVTRGIDPLGRETRIERDGYGLPVRVVDPGGGETLYSRDLRGNLLGANYASGAVTSIEYDSRGLVTKFIDANGGITRFSYDAEGNCLTLTQPDEGIWRYAYDALGRQIRETDPLGHPTHYSFTPGGDLVAVRDALQKVTQYEYDGEGHLTEIRSPQGSLNRLTWGGYHKLCARTDANERTVRFGYNVEGELTQVRNESGEVHRLEYSPGGLVRDEFTFDGRHLQYKHDKVGRPILIRSGDREPTELAFDLAGQLVSRVFDDGTTDLFEYDARGYMVRAKSPGGVETVFERDAGGRIVRELQTLGGVTHEVRVALGPGGDRVRRSTSLGHVEEVTRDRMGARRVTVLDGHVVEHANDALGREVNRKLLGGGRLESAYDPLGQLTERQVVTAARDAGIAAGEPDWVGSRSRGVTAHKAFRYNGDGELIEAWDQQRGPTEYRYDPVGQLLAMIPEKARAELFRYDANGNLYEEGPSTEKREYGKGNRLHRKGDTTYTWDDNGRLVEKRTANSALAPGGSPDLVWTYTWNGAGLMASAESNAGVRCDFTYDAFARRLEKRVSRRAVGAAKLCLTSRVRFVWDGDVIVHEIREDGLAQGDPIVEERTYLFEDDGFEPLAHREKRFDDEGRETGGWFHYLNDPAGAPDRLVTEDGSVAAEYDRGAWGTLSLRDGAQASTPIRLQGQYADEETGLAYNRWRYYADGTFVSADPLGLEACTHFYAFGPSTQQFIDPYGEERAGLRFAQKDLYQPKPGQKNTVKIKMQGARGRDFTQSNAKAGLPKKPKGYTWHHVDDFNPKTGTCTMQLVRTCAHKAEGHGGSVSQFESETGEEYGSPGAVKLAEKKGWLANPIPARSKKKGRK